MKRVLVFMMVSLLVVSMLAGCGKKKKEISIGDSEPSIESIRNLCELATLKCKFNNVARSTKSDGSGIKSLLYENREFWIEYTGVVEISYDLNDVKMEIQNNEVRITLPDCQIQTSIDPDSWTEDSYVSDEDKGLQKNWIKPEDVKKAIKAAQENMDSEVRSNGTLINSARKRAKDIIESYIEQMNKISNKEYKVTFLELEPDEGETK